MASERQQHYKTTLDTDNIKRHWNYRVVRYPSPVPSGAEYLQIHEIHYENGQPWGCSEDGLRLGGDTIEEIREAMRLIELALEKPVLDYETFWPKK